MVKKIGIVGAGLSGLAAAIELKNKGHKVKVFDQNPRVGGRVQTDQVEGFRLDRGFQVLLTSYPLVKKYLSLPGLKLAPFKPGALIYNSDSKKFEKISDPFRDPGATLATLFNSYASFKDQLLILKLKNQTRNFNLKKASGVPTHTELKKFGFSEKFIKNFFIPFFSGVFLEKNLETDSNFFKYLFSKFNTSYASLPEKGMGEIAQLMSQKLSPEDLQMNTQVLKMTKDSLHFGQTSENFDHVICALDQTSATNLLGEELSKTNDFRPVTTYYFHSPSHKIASKYLYLIKDKSINHIACLTAVQKSYAPKGLQLFSVNTLSHKLPVSEIRNELSEIFGAKEILKWTHLKTYHVKKALPKTSLYLKQTLKKSGIYFIGDYTQHPSIQGALNSAHQLIHEL